MTNSKEKIKKSKGDLKKPKRTKKQLIGTFGSQSPKQLPRFNSHPLPAGGNLPIRIPPSPHKVTILNPSNGQGIVVFTPDVQRLRTYEPYVIDCGGMYNFLDPNDGPYYFSNPLIGPNVTDVIIQID